MSSSVRKKRYDVATKKEVRRHIKSLKEMRRDARSVYGADYVYYDIFSQLWGWELYSYRKHPQEAVRRLQKAMQRQQRKPVSKQRPHDPELQFEVGVAYLSGWLPAKNSERRAAAWFERSAKQGSHQGLMALGYCHEMGIGGYPRDLQKMMDYYGRAAKQGNEPARYRIAKWMFEQENADDNLKEIKTLLYGAYSYPPADDLMDQVLERENELREEVRDDVFSRFREELMRDAQGRSAPEEEDDWDEFEDEDDWDEFDDEAGAWEAEDGDNAQLPEKERGVEDFAEDLRNMDWGLECLIPTEEQIRYMAQLQYQMSRTTGDEWYELSDRFDEYVNGWVDERLAQMDQKKTEAAEGAVLEKPETAEKAPVQQPSSPQMPQVQATNADIARIIDSMQALLQRMDIIEETTRQTHVTVQDTNVTVHRTEETVAEIQETVRSIRQLQVTQDQMWQTMLETEAKNARQKKHIQNLQTQTETALTKVSESILEEEENYLKWIFGDDWRNASRLCDASCDSLVTARVLMRCGSQAGIKNYAGIIITAISALEIETRRRFFDAYIRYLEALGRTRDTYPRNLTHNQKEETGEIYYTLGSFKYIVSAEKLKTGEWDNTVNNFLRDCILSEYAETIMRRQTYVFTDRDGNRRIQKYRHPNELFRNYIAAGSTKPFAQIVDDIVREYRNKSAHGDEKGMTMEDAQTCCSILGIDISPEMYDQLEQRRYNEQALKELLNIEGLLKELLRLTRPLE